MSGINEGCEGSEGCEVGDCRYEFVSPMNLDEVDVPSQAAEDRNVTNNDMYVRMRNDPRLRFKSRVIQTPFAVYSRKKKRILK